MNAGLDTDDMSTAKTTQTTATAASNEVVWVASGHLKQALFSL